jgi:hypothetical protein
LNLLEMDAQISAEIEQALADVSSNGIKWYGTGLTGTPKDLDLIQKMLSEGRVTRNDQMALWGLGLAFGNVLARSEDWEWAVAEEEGTYDPVLITRGSSEEGEASLLFPMTMISHRVEDGERVEVRELFKATVSQIRGR